jgi:sec-independent protein translocase protein TatB
MAVALIVVGPEKLPDLARGLAKQFFELKKAANVLKDSLQEEESTIGKAPVDQVLPPTGFSRPEQLAAEALKAQGTRILEPGSPREDLLAPATSIEPVETGVVAAQGEPGSVTAEVAPTAGAGEPGNPAPASTGGAPGKNDA